VEEKDRKALIISVKSNRFDSASSLSSLTALCSVSSYAVPINAVLPHPNSPRASIAARWGGAMAFLPRRGSPWKLSAFLSGLPVEKALHAKKRAQPPARDAAGATPKKATTPSVHTATIGETPLSV
jgi:hypothetical protein